MKTEMERKGAGSRALKLASLVLVAVGGLQAANLWTNPASSTLFTTISGDNKCDASAIVCSTGAPITIFDNFNIPNGSKAWVVSAVDFTDFMVNVRAGDYKSTSWSIWAGDPLVSGKLVASGSAVASFTLLSGTCGDTTTCTQMFTLSFGNTPVTLTANQTYYLGTSNVLVPSNGTSEYTARVFSPGGNTAPGGTVNALQKWEQSNGSTSGVVNSTWTAGTLNQTFPNAGLGINEVATAFDIQGTLAPEPGTITLLSLALAGCYLYLRRRTA